VGAVALGSGIPLRTVCLAGGFLCSRRYAWQVGAAAPTPSHSAGLGLSCRRVATAGKETPAILRAQLFTHKLIRSKVDEALVALIAAAALANCFIVVGETPRIPLSTALGFTCGGLRTRLWW
jgi:hypothetical protein